MLGYYIMRHDCLWLQDDEKSWGSFNGAQEFNDEQLAKDIAEREKRRDDTMYVFGLCFS